MKQTISKIRAELQAADVSRLPVFINTYKEDDRAGVRKLADIARKKMADYEKEDRKSVV